MSEFRNRSCGIWAVSEVLNLNYEKLLEEFYTDGREKSHSDGEPSGVLPIELHQWLWSKGHFNRLWIPMPESFKGNYKVPSLKEMVSDLINGFGVVGAVSKSFGTGHWIPVKFGHYKASRYSNWTPITDEEFLRNEEWDNLSVVLSFK